MMPVSLQRLGLIDALTELCHKQNQICETQFSFQAFGAKIKLPPNTEVMLYRISQEIIQNILKHANAAEVSMQCFVDNNELKLITEDDGCGFVRNESLKKGLGLQSLESRVTYLKGKLNIDSSLGYGTIVEICIPLNGHEHAA
jgi:signal transduction histidine kinase